MRRQTLEEQIAALTAERDAWKAMAEMLAARPIITAPLQLVPVQAPAPQPYAPYTPYTPGVYPHWSPMWPGDVICSSSSTIKVQS